MLNFKENNSLWEYCRTNEILDELVKYYPNIKSWFWDKVIPSVECWDSKIITLEDENDIIWFSILKNTEFEKKIRTLFITEKYRNSWNVLKILEKSMEVLWDDSPLYTVSEDFIEFYSKVAKRYNHKITWVLTWKYREWVKEYVFNKEDDYSTPYENYWKDLTHEELLEIDKYFKKNI